MGKATDPRFYASKKWKKERELYRKANPFCERCLARGIYKPTEIVHHKEYLDNIKVQDESLALSFDNLESLCFDCHNREHHTGRVSRDRRWYFENGKLVMKETLPL